MQLTTAGLVRPERSVDVMIRQAIGALTQLLGDGRDPAKPLGLEHEVRRQKTTLLLRNARIAAAVHVVNATLLAFVNAISHASIASAVLWWCLVLLVTAGRYSMVRRFAALLGAAVDVSRWQRRYIAATALAALVWGGGGAFFMWDAPDSAMLFTGMVLAGMTAGAVPLLAPVPVAFTVFAMPLIIPVVAVVLVQATSALHIAFGILALVFLITVVISARYLHETLDVSIRLGLEQRSLAEKFEYARDTAESALEQHKRTQSVLQASEERYRLILQYLPTGVLHYDRDLIVTYCNERLAEIIAVPTDVLIGVDMKTLKDQRFLPALRAALDGKDGAYQGEYVATYSDAEVMVSISCAPMRDAESGVIGGLAIVENITERRRAEDQIRHLAYFDPLTQLPNRRLLMDRLEQALIASERSGEFGAVMILDLDHFKDINDSQGHDIGDRLLTEVAHRLGQVVRQGDSIARLGGDEYVVLLEALGQSEQSATVYSERIAEKIRDAVSNPYVLDDSQAEYFSTTSIGLTLFRGQAEPAEGLIKQSDVALYQAKDAGRNAIRFFNPSMQAAIDSRLALEAALRRGLRDGEFRLFYQPQVDDRGQVIGAEALLRWFPSEQASVSPGQFIPVAEESGLIVPLGGWALDTACTQLKVWERDPRTSDLRLSVNVSARQFHQPDFVQQVRRSLLASGANPARLKLELTETVVLNKVDDVVNRMRELTNLGVGFSLDDFGTGYSSLLYLKRLPLEQVKIDQSFVQDVTYDPNDAAIVRAILAMSHSLGLNVIAEGVETDAQRSFLQAHGCRAYQGFLFGRPVPIDEWDTQAPGFV